MLLERIYRLIKEQEYLKIDFFLLFFLSSWAAILFRHIFVISFSLIRYSIVASRRLISMLLVKYALDINMKLIYASYFLLLLLRHIFPWFNDKCRYDSDVFVYWRTCWPFQQLQFSSTNLRRDKIFCQILSQTIFIS